jgi:hypothetical protein
LAGARMRSSISTMAVMPAARTTPGFGSLNAPAPDSEFGGHECRVLLDRLAADEQDGTSNPYPPASLIDAAVPASGKKERCRIIGSSTLEVTGLRQTTRHKQCRRASRTWNFPDTQKWLIWHSPQRTTAPSILRRPSPIFSGNTRAMDSRDMIAQRRLRDCELRREVVVKAAGLNGASGLNVARRHGLVAHFPE